MTKIHMTLVLEKERCWEGFSQYSGWAGADKLRNCTLISKRGKMSLSSTDSEFYR